MDAYERANSIEEQAMVRVREIYTAALRKALKEKKAFLQTVEAVRTGKKKPPAFYVSQGEEAVEKWKQGFIRELIRKEKVIEGIIAQLNAAGVEAADVIRGSMVDIYQTNREEAAQLIGATAEQADVNMTFAQYDKRQIGVILQENESPMSRIAYRNLGQNTAIRRRLQNELAQATILGEGQRELIKRIQKVTGMSVSQARRVAQTERTRVQSQARWQAGEEAKAAGVGVYNTWSTRMVNSRETHISLNGKKAMQGEPFVTSAGNSLKYPGDPSAPASEVINCHCVLVPDVLLPGERLDAEGNVVSRETEEWDNKFNSEYRATTENELIPNRQNAFGLTEKLIGYCLNMGHPSGRNKAIVFQTALGYNQGNSSELERAIRDGLNHYKAVPNGNVGYGNKFNVVMLVKGANGRVQPVETGWIMDQDRPRMVTAYVSKNQRP